LILNQDVNEWEAFSYQKCFTASLKTFVRQALYEHGSGSGSVPVIMSARSAVVLNDALP
jgi:hypothetical protein